MSEIPRALDIDQLAKNAETSMFFDAEIFNNSDIFSNVYGEVQKLKNNMWPTEAGETGHYIYDIDAGRLAAYTGDPKDKREGASNTASVLVNLLAIRLHSALQSNAANLPDIESIDDEGIVVTQTSLPVNASANAASDINKAIEKIQHIIGSDFEENSMGSKMEIVVEDMIRDYNEKKVNKEKAGADGNSTLGYAAAGALIGKVAGNNTTAVIGTVAGAVGGALFSGADGFDTNKSFGKNASNIVNKVVENVKKEAPDKKTLKNTHKGFENFWKDVGVKDKKIRNGLAITSEVVIAGAAIFKLIPALWKFTGFVGDKITAGVKNKKGVVTDNPWKSSALALTLATVATGWHYFSDENQASLNKKKREEAIKKKANGNENGIKNEEVINNILVVKNLNDTDEDTADTLEDDLYVKLNKFENIAVSDLEFLENTFKYKENFKTQNYNNVLIKWDAYSIKRVKTNNSKTVTYTIEDANNPLSYFKIVVNRGVSPVTKKVSTFTRASNLAEFPVIATRSKKIVDIL